MVGEEYDGDALVFLDVESWMWSDKWAVLWKERDLKMFWKEKAWQSLGERDTVLLERTSGGKLKRERERWSKFYTESKVREGGGGFLDVESWMQWGGKKGRICERDETNSIEKWICKVWEKVCIVNLRLDGYEPMDCWLLESCIYSDIYMNKSAQAFYPFIPCIGWWVPQFAWVRASERRKWPMLH